MLEVTKARFRNEIFARTLVATGNSLLHCVDSTRQSRYGVGSEGGQNLQGIILMLTRELLTGDQVWHQFLGERKFSFEGGFFAESGWTQMMRQAYSAINAVSYENRVVYDRISPFMEKAVEDGGYELLNPCDPVGDWVLAKLKGQQEAKVEQRLKSKGRAVKIADRHHPGVLRQTLSDFDPDAVFGPRKEAEGVECLSQAESVNQGDAQRELEKVYPCNLEYRTQATPFLGWLTFNFYGLNLPTYGSFESFGF